MESPKKRNKPVIITVFGSSQAEPSSPAYETAHELGSAIAAAGWTLCNGGYGGTMEAAARGAVEHGGHTIGVTCQAFGRTGPNPYIRQEVPTFDLLSRLNTLVRLGNGYVVLPGGTGTLLELALVWELLSKGLLRRRRPLVLLENHWQPVVESVCREQPDAAEALQVASNARVAVQLLAEHFGESRAEDGQID
jgi:uncharacterized protein (TIGR00730 family)